MRAAERCWRTWQCRTRTDRPFQQLRQLGDAGCDLARFVFRHEMRRSASARPSLVTEEPLCVVLVVVPCSSSSPAAPFVLSFMSFLPTTNLEECRVTLPPRRALCSVYVLSPTTDLKDCRVTLPEWRGALILLSLQASHAGGAKPGATIFYPRCGKCLVGLSIVATPASPANRSTSAAGTA